MIELSQILMLQLFGSSNAVYLHFPVCSERHEEKYSKNIHEITDHVTQTGFNLNM